MNDYAPSCALPAESKTTSTEAAFDLSKLRGSKSKSRPGKKSSSPGAGSSSSAVAAATEKKKGKTMRSWGGQAKGSLDFSDPPQNGGVTESR